MRHFPRDVYDVKEALSRLTGENECERRRNCKIAITAFIAIAVLVAGVIALVKFLDRDEEVDFTEDDFDEDDFEEDPE
jgi:hypothetical protein